MHLPVSGRVARVALWGCFRLNAAMVSEAGADLVRGGPVHHFPNSRPSDSLRCTYCGRSLSRRSQADSREPKKSDGTRLWKLRNERMSGNVMEREAWWQETPWSGLVASTIWSREDPLFPAHRQESTQLSRASRNGVLYSDFEWVGVFSWSLVLLCSTLHILSPLSSRIMPLLYE